MNSVHPVNAINSISVNR